MTKRVKKLSKATKLVKRNRVKPVSGVPRHNFINATPKIISAHKDSTQESATAFLQPFFAYQERLMPGLPVPTNNQAVYGFWTRNVIQFTDVAYGSGPNAGSWVGVSPWDINQVVVATAYADAIGTPNAYQGYNDPFYASCAANFESMACAYQGIRVKNLTPVLSQGGEALVARVPHGDSISSYPIMRNSGTSFVKSAADPGVMLTLAFQGTASSIPAVAGSLVDYGFYPPSASTFDVQSTRLMFRSQCAATAVQTWEIEIVTYYLARPFSTTSVFFAPTKHEIDFSKFDRLVEKAESAAPQFGVMRTAIKDDGDDAPLLADLSTIWQGAKAFGRVATQAWGALTSLFSLASHRRHLMAINMLLPDEMKEFSELCELDHDEAVNKLTSALMPKPTLADVDVEALLKRIAALEEATVWERLEERPRIATIPVATRRV